MDDALCLRTLAAVCVYVGHNIMAHLFFTGLGHIIIDIVLMGLQLVDLLLGNGKSQLHLGLSQGNPELSPGAELLVRGKDVLHLFTCVALG